MNFPKELNVDNYWSADDLSLSLRAALVFSRANAAPGGTIIDEAWMWHRRTVGEQDATSGPSRLRNCRIRAGLTRAG